jgi:short-subunit dehydrogenase
MSRFSNQVALITGATGGIGAALTRALAAEGAQVILVGRSRDKLEELAESVRGVSPEVDLHATDLADDGEVRKMAARVKTAFQGVDLLIHSAGVYAYGPVAEVAADEVERLFRVNARAPYYLTQLLLPSLVERGGQVAFVNSVAGLQARAGVAAYAASKFALKAIADALRQEVEPRGVRVISAFPARTATPMQEEVCRLEGSEYHPERFLQPADVAGALLDALAAPRTADVGELVLRLPEQAAPDS